MTTFAVIFLAAMNAAGTLGSPTKINQRDGINQEKLAKSALDGLSAEERSLREAEYERVGRDVAALLGFEFGKPFAAYKFNRDLEIADNANHPVYLLPKPVLGFDRFRPIVVTECLTGVLMTRKLPRCEKESDRQILFAEEDYVLKTNLVSVLGLSTSDFSRGTNGVPHIWRLSFERWRDKQVLRIDDRERASRLVRAAKAKAEAERLEQIKHLMHHDDPVSTASVEAKKETAE